MLSHADIIRSHATPKFAVVAGGSVLESILQGAVGEKTRFHRQEQRALALPCASCAKQGRVTGQAQAAYAGKTRSGRQCAAGSIDDKEERFAVSETVRS